MIDQLLRRGFIHEQLSDVAAELAAAQQSQVELPQIDGETPDADDVAAALEARDAARAHADDAGTRHWLERFDG